MVRLIGCSEGRIAHDPGRKQQCPGDQHERGHRAYRHIHAVAPWEEVIFRVLGRYDYLLSGGLRFTGSSSSLKRNRQADQLPIASNAELGANVGRVRANGLDAELQDACDFAMGQAPAEIFQHFHLARCKRGSRGRVSPLNQATIIRRIHTSTVCRDMDGGKNVRRRDIL